MRKNAIMLLVSTILFSSCHKTHQDIVEDFLDARNCYNIEKMSQYLSDDFIFCENDSLINKTGYLDEKWDTYKNFENKITILKIHDFDSIVKTEEKVSTVADSLLEVNPKVVVKKTYRFSDEKLKSIIVDTILNFEEYLKSFIEKVDPFYFYIQDKYDKDYKEINANIKQYLKEYTTLPVSEKKIIKKYANLQGVYVSDNCFYSKLTFRGKKTVSIRGFPFATSYELDENYVKIRMENWDLLLEIKDDKTLIGEGFAEGTYKKAD